MVLEQTQSDTPIYDELMASRQPELTDSPGDIAPIAVNLGAQVLQEVQEMTPEAEVKPVKEKKQLSSDGYSPGAKSVIDAINKALDEEEHTVHGRSFNDYVKDHQRYVTSHEFNRLQRDVMAL